MAGFGSVPFEGKVFGGVCAVAVVVKRICRMSAHSEVILEVFMEVEDTDYRSTNDDGEPEDFRIIRWFGTNFSAFPRSIEIVRPSGRNWRTLVLPAGESFSQSAGGPVKYESDVPQWRYS